MFDYEIAPPIAPEGPQRPDDRRWRLILSYRDHVTRLVRNRLWNPQDIDDCVQEVLLRGVLFPRLDEDRVGEFLTTTTLRLCVDYYRDWDRQRRLRLRVAFIERSAGPDEQIVERDLGRWMIERAGQLRGREQQIMLARAKGMTNREIADYFGLTAKAVESAFTRGRARLRMQFDHCMDGAPEEPVAAAAMSAGGLA
ncbi:sigma-70 family RNA polymerase sigma factor [Catellatospora sp. KI3]|uniref:RNA polymerase sigma factor n=1 Tax=Catellatospora sp. KI3 TaxID=3041620 RepID=UPI002482E5EE|nr:sigma-70 family RNA polymerase sigma factor [Catellatospora sp. KI3]MDI1461128.1 sigma-70 family RNA polymerase sigma factor [Catellatospora sp. KI3]